MDPFSIDGLGLTFSDLSADGQRKATFARQAQIQNQTVSDQFIASLTQQTSQMTATAAIAQEQFDKIGTTG